MSTRLIPAIIPRRYAIWVKARHIIPAPIVIIVTTTTLWSVNQITIRLVHVVLLVSVDNSLAPRHLTAALCARFQAVCVALSENLGLVAAANTWVVALFGLRRLINESVAVASWLRWGVILCCA